jgi:hypothetical protein
LRTTTITFGLNGSKGRAAGTTSIVEVIEAEDMMVVVFEDRDADTSRPNNAVHGVEGLVLSLDGDARPCGCR